MKLSFKKPLVILLIALLVIGGTVPPFGAVSAAYADEPEVGEPQEIIVSEEEAPTEEKVEDYDANAPPEEVIVESVEEIVEESEETLSEEQKEETTLPEIKEEVKTEVKEETPSIKLPNLEGMDFSTKRLIVKGEVGKNSAIISSYENVHLMQFDTEDAAKKAFIEFTEKGLMVEVDSAIGIAEETAVKEGATEVMEEGATPLDELTSLAEENTKAKFDVAVIDTGANTGAEILSVLGDDGKDVNGHGQAMIDEIKAISPDAKVLSIKAIGNDGTGDISAVYAAIKLAIEKDVKVINLSLSTVANTDSFIIEEAIEEAIKAGITVVGAAGNNASDASNYIPGRIARAVIVGADNSRSNFGETVDFVVPAKSTSFAAAKATGYIVKTGGVSGLNEFFAEKPEFEMKEKADVTLLAKYLYVDEAMVNSSSTFDSVVIDDELAAVLYQDSEDLSVYKQADGSYAALVNAPWASGMASSAPLDVAFARGNDFGMVIEEGVSFDAETKVFRFTEEALKGISEDDFTDIQIQLLVPIPRNGKVVSLDINDELGIASASSGSLSFGGLSFINFDLVSPEHASEVTDKNIYVYVDGMMTNDFEYSQEDGSILIPAIAGKLSTVRVDIKEKEKSPVEIALTLAQFSGSVFDLPDNFDKSQVVKGVTYTGRAYKNTSVYGASGSPFTSNNTYQKSYLQASSINGVSPSGWMGILQPKFTYTGGGKTITNFKLKGKLMNGSVGIGTESGIGYNAGIQTQCYHISKSTLKIDGDVDINLKCEDVVTKNGYTYFVFQMIEKSTYTNSAHQTQAGYIAARVKAGKEFPDNPTVVKLDEDGNQIKQEGIIFELKGPVTLRVKTDANGVADFGRFASYVSGYENYTKVALNGNNVAKIPAGTYTLTEIEGPDGYKKWSGSATCTITATPVSDGTRYVCKWTTPLATDTVKLDDAQATWGYQEGDTKRYNIKLGVKNYKWIIPDHVRITKIDASGNPVPGVIFQLEGPFENNSVSPVKIRTTTDDDGMANFGMSATQLEDFTCPWSRNYYQYLPEGIYKITEVSAPSGYSSIPGVIAEVVSEYSETSTGAIRNTLTIRNLVEGTKKITDNAIGLVDGTTRYWREMSVTNEKVDIPDTPIVYKVDEKGNRIKKAGAIFQLSGNGRTLRVATDANGIADFGMGDNYLDGYNNYWQTNGRVMFPGTAKYTLTEIAAPEGYDRWTGSAQMTSTKSETDDGIRYTITWNSPSGTTKGENTLINSIGVTPRYKVGINVINKGIKKGLYVQKVSTDPTITTSNSCYSFEGAEFGIYKVQNDAKDGDRSKAIEILVSNASGITNQNTVDLEPGKYYIRELTAPRGFKLNPDPVEVTLKSNEVTKVTMADEPLADPMNIFISKVPDTDNPDNVPSLEGAKFSVKYYDSVFTKASEEPSTAKRSWVFKTDQDGKVKYHPSYKESGNDLFYAQLVTSGDNKQYKIPVGTIVIQETVAPEGYEVNDNIFIMTFTIGEAETMNVSVYDASGNTINVYNNLDVDQPANAETIIMESITTHPGAIKKVSANPSITSGNNLYKFTGAKFNIYASEDDAVDNLNPINASPIVAKSNGTTDAVELQPGEYWVKEIEAPTGYKLNSTPVKMVVGEGQTAQVTIQDEPVYETAKFRKTTNDGAQVVTGEAVFKVEFFARTNTSGTATRTWFYKTNNGEIDLSDKSLVLNTEEYKSGAIYEVEGKAVLPLGSVKITEVKAPEGFTATTDALTGSISFVNNDAEFKWTSAQAGDIRYETDNKGVALIDNEPTGLPLKIKKVSTNPELTTDNANFSFDGATFQVFNTREDAVSGVNPIGELTANAEGTTNELIVGVGTYYVKETYAPYGYKMATEPLEVNVTLNGENTFEFPDEPIQGKLRVRKISNNTAISSGNDFYSLEGAEFTVYATEDDANKGINPIDVLTAAKNGYTPWSKPINIGKYFVKETKAPKNYDINEKVFAVTITTSNATAGVTSTIGNTPVPPTIKIKKVSAQPEVTTGNANYTLKNARFSIFTSEDDAKASRNALKNLTTDANGDTPFVTDLPLGTYYVKETRAPGGFNIDPTIKVIEATVQGEYTVEFVDTLKTARIDAKKLSAEPDVTDGNDSYSFEGAEFSIYHSEEDASKGVNAVDVLTAKKDGTTDQSKPLPYGKYYVKETKAPKGFKLNSEIKMVELTVNGQTVEHVEITDEVIKGKIRVMKLSSNYDVSASNPEYSMEGAEFTIYPSKDAAEMGRDAIEVLVTGSDGISNESKELPLGTYYVRETKAPKGFSLNNNIFTVNIPNDEVRQIEVEDKIIENPVQVKKVSSKPEVTDGNTNYSLAGAIFGVYANEEDAKSDSNRLDTLTTNAHGDTNLSIKLPLGSYWIKEVHAPTGFKLNEEPVEVKVEAGGTAVITISDEPIQGPIKVKKVSENEAVTKDNGMYAFTGATFSVFKSEEDAVSGKNIVATLTAKANGETDATSELPLGEYWIKETKAPKGYILNTTPVKAVVKDSTLAVATVSDIPMTATGEMYKTSYYKDSVVADRPATFKVEYFAKNSSEGEATRTWYYATKAGHIDFSDASLLDTAYESDELYMSGDKAVIPLGKIKVTEEKAPQGFIKSNDVLLGEVVASGNSAKFNWTSEARGHISYSDNGSARFANELVPEISTTAMDLQTEGHTGALIEKAEIKDVVQFKNLELDTNYRFEAKLRYAYDYPEDGIKAGDEIARTNLEYFTRVRDGRVTMPTFRIDARELQGKTIVITEILYDIDEDKVVARHEDLMNEKQSIHYPDMGTNATDISTKVRTAVVGKTTIVDEVHMTNLVVGETYTVTGDLVYNDNYIDINGDTHKKGDVISTHEPVEVTATSTEMTIELKYEVDASTLEGISGVVFEDMTVKGYPVAHHHDFESIPQTPNWPKVRTSAVDGATKTRSGVVGEKATIVDTVTLTNLTVGDTYKVVGTLMNSDGTVFKGAEPVESELFEAETKNMTKEITFEFNSKALEGKDLVVFEKLFVQGVVDLGTSIDEESGTAVSGISKELVEVARHEDLKDTNQTVHYPKGRTNATDGVTNDEVGKVGETETIVDKVTYENLVVGEKYEITGDLHYKEDCTDVNGNKHKAGDTVLDKDGNPYTASVTFTADTPSGFKNLVYHVDSNVLKGLSVVVFEDILHQGITIYQHADINDKDQRVDYPEVKTTAVSEKTGDHVGDTNKETTIIDKVELINLTVGKTYTVNGSLIDKDTKKVLAEGTTGEFEATERNMTVEIPFTIDGSVRENTTTVAFEELIHNNVLVAYHKDINDEGQSVHTPKVRTSAKDAETKDNIGRPREETVIIDAVTLNNLIIGQEYTVDGVLMNQDTNEKYVDADGKEVTATKTFKADKTDMVLELEFKFNGSNLRGTTVVVFEDLKHNDVIVAAHHDLTDEKQSVDYPDGSTKAEDAKTETQMTYAETEAKVIDTFKYEKLLPGREYTLKGKLVNKATGEAISESTIKFTPEERSGEAKIEFTFDASLLAGETYVAFERVEYKGVDIIIHEDLEDEDQTIYVPKIGTVAVDKTDNDNHILDAKEQVIVDTIKYENLVPNTEYHAYLTMFDKTTGELTDVKADMPFISSETGDGTVEVEVTLDGTEFAGHVLVAFERVYVKTMDKPEVPEEPNDDTPELPDNPVGTHEDPDDEDQTIYVPKIRTKAVDKADNNNQIFPKEEQTVVDTIIYEGLQPGKVYRAVLEVFDKTTSELTGITADGKFMASETGSGEAEVEVTFDGTPLAGHILVMFEKVYTIPEGDTPEEAVTPEEPTEHTEPVEPTEPTEPEVPGDLVGQHEDPDDVDQTIFVPEIGTKAYDKADSDNIIYNNGEITIVDKISYKGLAPGKYTVNTVLMDKATNKPLMDGNKEVTKTEEVEITEPDGFVEVAFTLDSKITKSHTIVVFEEIYLDGVLVAEHKDIEDEPQTVYAPNAKTTLTAGGKKQVQESKTTKLVDTVAYNNLIPGKEYTLTGELIRKDSGKVIATATTKFTASETGSGKVDITFTVDTTKVAGKNVVAFETVTYEENGKVYKVCEHKDKNDKDQTVYIVPKPNRSPKTGDTSDIAGMTALFTLAGLLTLTVYKRRKMQ